MTKGICPFAVWRPTTNFGYGGREENRPLLFVDHIMGGYKSTMDNTAWLNGSGISSHFGIGKDGSISQYVNIFEAAYGNGLVGQSPRGSRRGIDLYNRANPRLAHIEQEAGANWRTVELSTGPKWTLSIGGANAWNVRSISTEHEGLNQNDAWVPAMVDADIRVKRWCSQELVANGYSAIPFLREGIIGHNDIDAIDRPYCPGPGRPLDTIIAALNQGTQLQEDEIMNTYNGIVPRLQQAVPPLHVQADEFINAEGTRLPTEVRRLRIEVYLKLENPPGTKVQVKNGDGSYAGQVGWDGAHYGVVDVDVTGGFGIEGNAQLAQVGIVGWW